MLLFKSGSQLSPSRRNTQQIICRLCLQGCEKQKLTAGNKSCATRNLPFVDLTATVKILMLGGGMSDRSSGKYNCVEFLCWVIALEFCQLDNKLMRK